MPVRNIPKNHLSLTGRLPSQKLGRPVAFESPLERDAYLIFEFDSGVISYEEQPVRIDYLDEEGKSRHYTPDVLVQFAPGLPGLIDSRPRLFEIKSLDELRKKGREFAPRFRAARTHAKIMGWRFGVLTEREIRGPLLLGIRHLAAYTQTQLREPELLELVRAATQSGMHATVGEVLDALSASHGELEVTDAIWYLAANHQIFVDLSAPLTRDSRLIREDGDLALRTLVSAHLGLIPRSRQRARRPDPAAETQRVRYEEADLDLTEGATVRQGAEHVVVVRAVDLERVLVRNARGVILIAAIHDLQPAEGSPPPSRPEIAEVSDEAWRTAVARFEAVQPLLQHPTREVAAVRCVADRMGVSVATVYRWRAAVQRGGIAAVVDRPKPGGRNMSRLPAKIDEVIKSVLNEQYLVKRHASIPDTILAIERACRKKNLTPPHANTIRNRIRAIPPTLLAAARGGTASGPKRGSGVPGQFPHADGPLSVVQIDHALADVLLVDDEHRRSIGRPWLTVAIDVWSRVILGILITLDAPSTLSVGLCLHHAMFPKTDWLCVLGLDANAWPCYGTGAAVHADNAKEFRGAMLQKAAMIHGFRLEWRPVKTPQYGAHIERYMGTVQREMKILPGATDSDVVKRAGRDAEASAVLTLSEYTTYLVRWLTGVYHTRKHAELGMSPLDRWRSGLTPSSTGPGVGLPPRRANSGRVLLDFLPFEMRTIRPDGIYLEHLRYFDPILRTLQPSRDRSRKRPAPQFLVRYDPRDMSRVFLLDPTTGDYIVLPLADRGSPHVSLFEVRRAAQTLRNAGKDPENADAIFTTIEANRALVDAAVARSSKARREQQRRKHHRTAREVRVPPHTRPTPATPPGPSDPAITPFHDVHDPLEYL